MNNKNTRFTLLIVIQAFILVLVVLLLLTEPEKNNLSFSKTSADKLHAAGLVDEAISFYEKSFFEGSFNSKDMLSLSLTLGELYQKQGLSEKALAWFYMAESLGPTGDNKNHIAKSIVSLLEKLGKHSFSKLSLEQKTALNNQPTDLNVKILAKVGDKNIYDSDLRNLVDNFQNYSKQKIDKNMKLQLLQKLVADELLHQKAMRLNLTDSDDFKKKINSVSKEILVELVLKDEVHKKIDASSYKLKKYYEENSDQFNVPETYQIGYVTTKDKNESERWVTDLQKGKKLKSFNNKNYVEHRLSPLSPIAGMDSTKTMEIINNINKNKTGQILANGQYYVYELIQKIPGKKNSYEEVQDQVKNAYQMNEAKNLYQEMIQNLMAQEEVKLYPENINE
ncbi:MAG: hypothetical protein A2381_18340 [Bdellovibrionales bacterium RIFOXYB1_FULL_37_110]|nr:MAG: hypothetical protein A2417_01430 [Bdellovibrionales bacterium RIFOXYC1_FULL_37_79]OFZ58993.1 MAG: hypothetical protein A2381_18340 [Bdellovibrionales bacterium RIFOXYB1_FULL_37_110]OFZ64713.1 MAG: hypothetical protein A2577_06575 [Bdellovibrionales bacterium RIFOXYD1_FULL_36_51]